MKAGARGKITRKYLPEIFVSEFDMLKARAREMAYHIIERVIEEPGMKTMDPAQMEPILQSMVDEYPYVQYIYVVNIHGIKITRTICQPVDQAKFANVAVGENYSDRPWFVQPLKDGKIHVTDLYSSKHTGALSALRFLDRSAMRPARSGGFWASTSGSKT